MSDRFLIFSDLHIHNHGNDWRRVDDALNVLDWVKETALEKDINKIFFLGDWFHVRGYAYPSILARTYHKLMEFKDAGLELMLLVGNHDMPYKSTTKHNSLTVYNSIFPIIEQPMVFEGEDHDFFLLPYVENPTQLNWAINQIVSRGQGEYASANGTIVRRSNHSPSPKKRVLLAHLDIKDALYHTNVESTHGVDAGSLADQFDLVISGHYHIPQQVKDNVWYVGSPYQHNFGEAGQDKGLMIFEDGELSYVQNDFSPRFIYVNHDKIDERITGNYVKIEANSADNIAALREEAAQFNPRKVSITLNPDRGLQGDFKLKSNAKDIKTLLREWVDKNANSDEYDKEKLYYTGVDIVNSVKGES